MADAGFGDLKHATIDDTTLAYREQGDGEAVLFVHGGISDLTTWEQQLAAIGGAYRAISYSRRYARPNPDIDPAAEDPWERHADDLAAFLRAIGAAPAHLVGNSQGAFIALRAAIRYPEVVRSLVLEEPPVTPLFFTGFPPRPAQVLRLLATRPRTAIGIFRFISGAVVPATKAFERGDDEGGLWAFSRGVMDAAAFEGLSEAHKQRMRDNISTLRAGMLHPGFPPLGDDEVRGVRVPVLLLTGDRSPAFLLRLTDRLEELLPNVERAEIPDASHVMHEDNPPALNQAILGFLERQRAPH